MRIAVGCDLATSSNARSDWSAAVVLGSARIVETVNGRPYRDGDEVVTVTRFYVLHVDRRQGGIAEVEAGWRQIQAWYPSAGWSSYVAGAERGIYDLLASRGFAVGLRPARYSKYVRAQRTAAAWAAGRILLPPSAPWMNDFLAEVHMFTGLGDAHDDQLDALVAAFDVLESEAWLGDGVTWTHGKRIM